MMSKFNLDRMLLRELELLPQGGFPLKHRTNAQFWMAMLLTTLLVFGVSFAVLQHRYNQGARQLDEVIARHTELYLRLLDLEDEMEYVQTDEYIQRAARDDLGLIMPGEVRYVNSN